MAWALIFVLVVVILMLLVSSREQVPWMSKLRRLHAGVAHKAEWMAPAEVVAQVQADYHTAITWLQQSVLAERPQQMASAPLYLAGPYLKRFQTVFQQSCPPRTSRFVGVMHAQHRAHVHHFSEDGLRCLVIDCQTGCHVLTYDQRTRRYLPGQALDDAALVFQMIYDSQFHRWKIEAFVQQLPSVWMNRKLPQHVRLSSWLPTAIGRDH